MVDRGGARHRPTERADVGVGVGQRFTTRPELCGTFGMVSSTHWTATATAMRMLELGGNAFDAAVAAGFVLHVVQPHLNGPGGDMPIIIWDQGRGRSEVLCAQGVAPSSATPERFAELGLDTIPGTGLLAACVPGAIDGWLTLLRERGTLTLRQVLEPAIGYAANGHPVSPEMHRAVAAVADLFVDEWPTSAEVWLDHGQAPAVGSLFRHPTLAATYQRLLSEAEASTRDRDDQIAHARDAFYRGFVVETISAFLATAEVMDVSGQPHRGLLAAHDMTGWSATWEAPLAYDFRDVTVCKPGPWSQGPVLLQQLAMLADTDLAAMDRLGAEYVHTLVETAKLAYADRNVFYADPAHADVPIAELLSGPYAADRRGLIGPEASLDQRPGQPLGRVPFMGHLSDTGGSSASSQAGVGEPTVALVGQPAAGSSGVGVHLGDTCHVDVVDRFGNMISATPSGGWLQSSPVIPELGFSLGTRMQMFDLVAGAPNLVAPGKRPRTTLSPSFAMRDGEPWLAFGTPGGDQQDQWTLQFLLNVVVFGDGLQAAIDHPVFQTAHFHSSFFPRRATPGRVYMEERFPPATVNELLRRGHDIALSGPWSLSRMCAVSRDRDGTLRAGANPRGMEGYAIGR
jgi:gamma-glutamyltranspeptidase/glutathione hydrolase